MLIKVKNPHFFVFSDDLNWVKENLKTNVNITFVDSHNDSCNELNIMKYCKTLLYLIVLLVGGLNTFLTILEK